MRNNYRGPSVLPYAIKEVSVNFNVINGVRISNDFGGMVGLLNFPIIKLGNSIVKGLNFYFTEDNNGVIFDEDPIVYGGFDNLIESYGFKFVNSCESRNFGTGIVDFRSFRGSDFGFKNRQEKILSYIVSGLSQAYSIFDENFSKIEITKELNRHLISRIPGYYLSEKVENGKALAIGEKVDVLRFRDQSKKSLF